MGFELRKSSCPEKWGLLTPRTPNRPSSTLEEGEQPGAMGLLSGRPWATEAVKHINPQARASGPCIHRALMGLNGPKS